MHHRQMTHPTTNRCFPEGSWTARNAKNVGPGKKRGLVVSPRGPKLAGTRVETQKRTILKVEFPKETKEEQNGKQTEAKHCQPGNLVLETAEARQNPAQKKRHPNGVKTRGGRSAESLRLAQGP